KNRVVENVMQIKKCDTLWIDENSYQIVTFENGYIKSIITNTKIVDDIFLKNKIEHQGIIFHENGFISHLKLLINDGIDTLNDGTMVVKYKIQKINFTEGGIPKRVSLKGLDSILIDYSTN